MIRIDVDEKLCKGCNICIAFCPGKVFKKNRRPSERGVYVPIPDAKKCLSCGMCTLFCPDFAISVVK